MPVPALVAAIAFAVYCHKPLIQSSMDNQPLRWGAALIASQHTTDFSVIGMDPARFYCFRSMPDGSVRSHTPLGTAFLAAPVFAAARALGAEFTPENVVFLDSLSASLLTALAAGLLAWLARAQGRRTAFFVGISLALATASWSTASRNLWQHTGAQFALLGALALLEGNRKSLPRVMAGAAMLAFATWCRPFLAPACALLLAYELRHSWKAALSVVGVVGVLFSLWAAYNYATTGNMLGTYVAAKVMPTEPFRGFLTRLGGSLLSANRGMFVFSPLLLLGIPAVAWSLSRWRTDPRSAVLACAVLLTTLPRGFLQGWHGGHCYGSRYMLDAAALMLLVMAPLVRGLLQRNWWTASLPWALFALSASIQYLGVTRDFESWNIVMKMNLPDNAWTWRKGQIAHCLTYGESTRGPRLDAQAYNLPADGVIDPKGRAPDNRFIRYGVTYQDPWGPWLMPPRAGLLVNLPRQMPLKLRVEVTSEAFQYDPTIISYYWNGTKFQELVMQKKDFGFTNVGWFDVPEKLVRPGLNTLEIRVSRAYYPGASPAALGAALGKVIIQPAN
jgi:hypothetical protein